MDKATLVDRDLRIGRDVIGLLRAADLSVDDAFWAYVPQVEEWRLVLSSARVKELGVRNSYLRMSNALHKSPLWNEIPLSRISLLAPDDDVIERLKDLEKHRYEGAIEIIKSDRKNGSASFLVFFAPYKGEGGAVPLNGTLKLEEFLRDQIGINDSDIHTAFRELDTRGSYSFEGLRLTTAELRKVGLLHPLHPQRVYRKQ
jgi:hypothetical protein